MNDDIQAKFLELDAVGEETVRQNVALGKYHPRTLAIVNAWLGMKDRQRSEVKDLQAKNTSRQEWKHKIYMAIVATIAAICSTIAAYFTMFKH